MRIPKVTLNDVFQLWSDGGGVFNLLTTNHNVPWRGTVSGDVLDLDYHGNRSGNKIISPLLLKLILDGEISIANKNKIVNLVYLKYGEQWSHLWETLSYEYNPLENYNGTETETINNTSTANGSTSSTNNGTSTSSNNGTDTQHTKENGYNTSVASNTSEVSVTSSANGSTNSTDSGSSTTSSDTTGNTTRTLTKSGNLGITTSQQMITSERELWFWNYFEQIYKDVDTICCSQVYGDCETIEIDGLKYELPIATATKIGGVKIGNGIDVSSDGTISTDGGWELVATMTDDCDINIDLTGKKEMLIYGVTVGTGSSNLCTNWGTICSSVVANGTRRILSHHKDVYTFIEPLSSRYSTSTTVSTLGSTLTGYAFTDKNICDITNLYISNPSNVKRCDIKIYAR